MCFNRKGGMMNLVVMAAGMGSRFGGLKQLTPVGPNGELIIDYSIYDAKKAGIDKVIFVIKEEMHKQFQETIGKRIEKVIPISYVFQKLESTPISVNVQRTKPWGTGQALLASQNEVNSSFMVMNADDFYGRDAILQLGNFLKKNPQNCYAMVAYSLKNTLSDNGTVSRGVCELNNDNSLKTITEYTAIKKIGEKIVDLKTNQELDEKEAVSLNLFGFSQDIFNYATQYFKEFLSQETNLEQKEFYLPSIVQEIITREKKTVAVLSTTSKFHGITYQKDLEKLKKYIHEQIKSGIYPDNLWEENNEHKKENANDNY